MKTILVTGGAGFLGSNLCEELLNRGNRVICLDDLSTGLQRNVDRLREYNNFSFVNHDIEHPIDVPADEIYNLACPASPPQYQKNPIKTNRTCVLGAINVLDLADRYSARVLQASTSEVYGDPEIHPQPETYWGNVNPFGERACYDEGKRCAESLFYSYNRQRKTDIRVARIFNTYGPFMDLNDGRVVSNFIIQAIKEQPLTIYGDGSTTRSFCYVDDTVQGLIKLMDSSVKTPVNIGNPSELSLVGLAQEVIRQTNTKSSIEYFERPSDDPHKRKPDITVAKQFLDWQPNTRLSDGLSKSIQWFRNEICQ